MSIQNSSKNFSGVFAFLIMSILSTSVVIAGKPFESILPEQPNGLDTLIFGKRLVIKDTTQYSSTFIKQLKEGYMGYETLKVTDDSLIIASKIFNSKRDTLVLNKYLIPTNLQLNKEFEFSAREGARRFGLTLKRTNYTNIEYKLKLAGKTIQSGMAMLQSSFYFGKEISHDKITGKELLFDQYIDQSSHWAEIKVEIGKAGIVLFITGDASVRKLGEIPELYRE